MLKEIKGLHGNKYEKNKTGQPAQDGNYSRLKDISWEFWWSYSCCDIFLKKRQPNQQFLIQHSVRLEIKSLF